MRYYRINGNKQIDGSIVLQGAKNSVLPILAATLLIKSQSVIHNCPSLTDVDAAVKILISLGCVCIRDSNTVIVDAEGCSNFFVSKELMREMRSSVVFLGAIISRMGRATIYAPGGCELGKRPIDIHLSALSQLGAEITEDNGEISCIAKNGLIGANITLPFESVGATENIIIAAALAKGTTVIKNAAKEPEISDLADFLNSAGAKIKGAGSSTVIIEGVKRLHSTEHTVIADRIAAATYLSCAAVTNGKVELKGCPCHNMACVLKFFEDIGCTIKHNDNNIYLKTNNHLGTCKNITTGVYPYFPTDAGPLIVPVFTSLKGKSTITETIFSNRFAYVEELNKLGANIVKDGNTASVYGQRSLIGANVSCTDLRGGAALVIAALKANGISNIDNIHHIERGYYKLPENLQLLGADIKEMEN